MNTHLLLCVSVVSVLSVCPSCLLYTHIFYTVCLLPVFCQFVTAVVCGYASSTVCWCCQCFVRLIQLLGSDTHLQHNGRYPECPDVSDHHHQLCYSAGICQALPGTLSNLWKILSLNLGVRSRRIVLCQEWSCDQEDCLFFVQDI